MVKIFSIFHTGLYGSPYGFPSLPYSHSLGFSPPTKPHRIAAFSIFSIIQRLSVYQRLGPILSGKKVKSQQTCCPVKDISYITHRRSPSAIPFGKSPLCITIVWVSEALLSFPEPAAQGLSSCPRSHRIHCSFNPPSPHREGLLSCVRSASTINVNIDSALPSFSSPHFR